MAAVSGGSRAETLSKRRERLRRRRGAARQRTEIVAPF